MADQGALSRREIEALLKEVPAGDSAEPPSERPTATALSQSQPRVIKNYDFRRPDKFSKEQWATLQAMHEHFARMLGAAFSSRLRTLVTIRLSSIDQGLYEEWQSQVANPTICYVVSMPPLSGNFVVELNLDIAAEIVDRLLGGTGSLVDRTREVGEVELGLLRSFSRTVTKSLQEMWSSAEVMEPILQDVGQDAGLIQVAAPTDVVLTAFFEVSIAGQIGSMSICVPYTVIEPAAPSLSAQLWIASGHRAALSDGERRAREHLIGRTRLDVSVRLGSVELPARSVAAMQEGDTVVLDARLGRPLDVIVGDRARFLALPGVVGSHMGVQVLEVVPLEQLGFAKHVEPKTVDVPPTPPTPTLADVPVLTEDPYDQ